VTRQDDTRDRETEWCRCKVKRHLHLRYRVMQICITEWCRCKVMRHLHLQHRVMQMQSHETSLVRETVKKTTCKNIWPRINSLIKTARSAVSKNRAERGCFFLRQFWKHDISSASEQAFPGFFEDIFVCSTPSNKSSFSAQDFTRSLSTVSSQRRATRYEVSFQTTWSECLVASKSVGFW